MGNSSSKYNKFAQVIADEYTRRQRANEPPIPREDLRNGGPYYHRDGEPRWEILKTGGRVSDRQRTPGQAPRQVPHRPRGGSAPAMPTGWQQTPQRPHGLQRAHTQQNGRMPAPDRGRRPRQDSAVNRYTGERAVPRQQQQGQPARNPNPQRREGPAGRNPARNPPVQHVPQSEPQVPQPAPSAVGGKKDWTPDMPRGPPSQTVRFHPGDITVDSPGRLPQRPQPAQNDAPTAAEVSAAGPRPRPGASLVRGPSGLLGWDMGPMTAKDPPAPTTVAPRLSGRSNRSGS